MPYLDCLIRSGQTEQIGADRGRRLEQLNGAFRVNKANLQGRRLLLIDDVITTGATLEAAAATLAAAGAGTVEALVFCAA
jgi:predicted amidophosphoribosyltransferase